MKTLGACAFGVTLLIASFGCGDSEPAVVDDATGLFADLNAFAEKRCACLDDTATCRSDPETGVFSDESIQCAIAVLEANDEEAVASVVACEAEGWRNVAECSAALTCPSSAEEFATCANLVPQCADFPAAVETMVSDCFPE